MVANDKNQVINNIIVVIMVYDSVYDPLTYRFFPLSPKPKDNVHEIHRHNDKAKQLTKDAPLRAEQIRQVKSQQQAAKIEGQMQRIINYGALSGDTIRNRSRWQKVTDTHTHTRNC